MKTVLMIDTLPLFREFLKSKLSEEKVEVLFTQEKKNAFPKMISSLPNLVLLDISETDDFAVITEFLQKKSSDPNTRRIPMIVTGPVVEREGLAIFASSGIIKYFTKPIQFDLFFEAIGVALKSSFSIDVVPCVLDIHRSGDIIVIEVAKGLNREKLSLLKFRLSEMIAGAKLQEPKIVLMLTDLDLTFVDGANLEFLFDNILSAPGVSPRRTKILSSSLFVREMVDGHPRYRGIEVAENLPAVLDSLVDNTGGSSMTDLVLDRILTPSADAFQGSVETRFHSDTGVRRDGRAAGEESAECRIAIVDDDAVICRLLDSAFQKAGARCDTYTGGTAFLAGVKTYRYDLVVLDILMPGISGFDTLKKMQTLQDRPPVIVYSQATQKEQIVQALSLGASRYLLKPQKPEVIVSNARELLNGKL